MDFREEIICCRRRPICCSAELVTTVHNRQAREKLGLRTTDQPTMRAEHSCQKRGSRTRTSHNENGLLLWILHVLRARSRDSTTQYSVDLTFSH